MDIAEIVEKMIGLSDGNVEDINHYYEGLGLRADDRKEGMG